MLDSAAVILFVIFGAESFVSPSLLRIDEVSNLISIIISSRSEKDWNQNILILWSLTWLFDRVHLQNAFHVDLMVDYCTIYL